MRQFRTLALAAALAAGSAAGAQAAVVFATDATIVVDGPRGSANDRANLANALGPSLGDFFELGYGAVVDFTFGRFFTGPGNIVEVTFGNPARFLESVRIQAGRGGVFEDVAVVSNIGAQAPAGASFAFSGVYNTLRLIDESPVRGRAGGFDVDRVSVSAIPVPAAGALLLGALGALGWMRHRRG